MGRIWVELGIKMGEADLYINPHRMAPTREFGLVGATHFSFMAPTRRISSGRRHTSLENQGGAALTRRILLVGAACSCSFFFDSSFLDSFSSLSKSFPNHKSPQCESTIIRTSSVLSPNHRNAMESQRTIENAPKLIVSRKIT